MAVGDVKSDLKSIAPGESLEIRPPAGEEWVIHNIYYEGSVELYFADETSSIKFDSATGPGAHLNFNFHPSNSRWIRVKNVEGTAKLIGYDGVVTKSAS